jgi:hypothetical protein
MAILAFMLSGCDPFEGDQTVPSYLHIDSIGFNSDILSQGTDIQYIADAWVFVNDELVGGFELPATIPILEEGPSKLEIRPGIILNGISDTRAPHPCMKPVTVMDFNLVIDSVVTFSGASTYLDNAVFVWMEDFEDASLAIKKGPQSDTSVARTQPANAQGAFINDHSEYSGISYVTDDRPYLMLVSDDGNNSGFVFDRGDFVIMELHYRIDFPLAVGLFIKLTDNTVQQRSFLIINPTDTWKKIYVNFTPIVNETVDAVNYKVFFETDHSLTGSDGVVMLDNIKLITRPNL